MAQRVKSNPASDELKGWQETAAFLGQPVAIAQRWARTEGMPTERRGRFVYASREELNHWLGRESAGEPVQITTTDTDLGAELKRGLSFVRRQETRCHEEGSGVAIRKATYPSASG